MFIDENFMLNTKIAQRLYHAFAEQLPIVDYHCHIDPRELAENKGYSTITELWLGKGGSYRGDHYKWRLMRACGIDEKYITGCEDDEIRFFKWAECLEKSIGNPLFHWSHMELKKYFGISDVLNRRSAAVIYRKCNEKLADADLTPAGILQKSNVQVVCTTDDPADTLEWHDKLHHAADIPAAVLPAFRPDKAVNINDESFPAYIDKLSKAAGIEVLDFDSLKDALKERMDYFGRRGCRVSDHAIEKTEFIPCKDEEITQYISDRLNGRVLTETESKQYRTVVMLFLGEEYAKRGWVMQLHIGVKRNANSVRFEMQGPDTGYDCIGAPMDPEGLIRYLNILEVKGMLPKTILYSIHPADDPVIDTVIGCFQNSQCEGKLQHGSAWWFNDHLEGMTQQLVSLADRGCLGTFIGMLTDSRCLLSYTRHDYFRRVLCRLIGEWVEDGFYPDDDETLGMLIKNISFKNAVRYFDFEPLIPGFRNGWGGDSV